MDLLTGIFEDGFLVKDFKKWFSKLVWYFGVLDWWLEIPILVEDLKMIVLVLNGDVFNWYQRIEESLLIMIWWWLITVGIIIDISIRIWYHSWLVFVFSISLKGLVFLKNCDKENNGWFLLVSGFYRRCLVFLKLGFQIDILKMVNDTPFVIVAKGGENRCCRGVFRLILRWYMSIMRGVLLEVVSK